jgi:hypothetical protein
MWLLAHAIGGILGTLAGISAVILATPCLSFTGYGIIYLAPLVGAFCFIVVLSLAQYKVLETSYSLQSWTRNSVLGGVLALAAGSAYYFSGGNPFDFTARIAVGALGGALVGLSQWLILRGISRLSQAWVWVPANVVAGAVGLAGADVVYRLIFSNGSSDFSDAFSRLAYNIFAILAYGMVASMLAAFITGWALFWMEGQIRQQKPLARRE